LARAAAALAVTLALVLAAAGCGKDEGVAAGATVRVYAGSGPCRAARRALDSAGGKAGALKVELVCLAPATSGSRLDLATLGADARRATEDSTAVAYLEAPGEASEFVAPILEEAGIALVAAGDGARAMRRALAAIGEAGSGGLRAEVQGELEPELS
jgi:hypothetical protein